MFLKIRELPLLRRLIVSLIDGALKDVRPANWAFTPEIKASYICTEEPDENWKPSNEYFFNIGELARKDICELLVFFSFILETWRT